MCFTYLEKKKKMDKPTQVLIWKRTACVVHTDLVRKSACMHIHLQNVDWKTGIKPACKKQTKTTWQRFKIPNGLCFVAKWGLHTC